MLIKILFLAAKPPIPPPFFAAKGGNSFVFPLFVLCGCCRPEQGGTADLTDRQRHRKTNFDNRKKTTAQPLKNGCAEKKFNCAGNCERLRRKKKWLRRKIKRVATHFFESSHSLIFRLFILL
jgi:hypothetical protein